ncbi:MAG: acetyl-CoA C-acyltransferase FadI [Myxococcota bacterium]
MPKPIRLPSSLDRVAIVGGARTPFAKRGTTYRNLTALEMGMMATRGVVDQVGLSPKDLDAVVFGQVIPSPKMPNIAREIVLGLDLPRSVDAHSVSRACATSTQAVATAAMMIQTGQAEVVIAGGSESMSDVPITVKRALAEALTEASGSKKPLDKIRAFSHLAPSDLVPEAPAIAEYSTGLTMGQSAEKMAQENGITREAQDEFAHRSHQQAAQAYEEGRFRGEVIRAFVPPGYDAYDQDNLIRFDSELSKYRQLPPVFDREWGSVTAANSSPLTDGASAVVLMRSDVARALGHQAWAYIKSFAFAALDPSEQLLMGPAYAGPRAMDAAGVAMKDLDIIDFHEAFAAQILSNLQAYGSRRFAEEKLGRSQAVGEIPMDKFNIYGGSIALGHPFAATGTRQLTTVARELDRRGGGLGLVAQCAAGGLGAAVVLER